MLSIWLIVGIALMAIVVIGLLYWANQPIAYRGLLLTDSQRFLESFILQSGTGSVFLLERQSSPGFLQLAIGEQQGPKLEVEFGLPDAEWSRKHFDLVHAATKNAGYSNRIETNPGNKDIPRFLRVYVAGNRGDLILGSLQILQLAADKLGFNKDDRYTLRMSGAMSSEYRGALATQLEQLGSHSRIAQMVATWLRRSATTR
jgi:hypothetical protein